MTPENPWLNSIGILILATGVAGMTSFLLGYSITLGMLLSLSGYLIWMLRHLYRFERWLQNPVLSDAPESRGLWGRIFDRIYLLQKKEKAARKTLHQVIKRAQDSTNTLTDGVVILDEHGLLEWWNRTAAKLLNLRTQDRGLMLTHLLRDPAFKQYFESETYQIPLVLTAHNKPLEFHVTQFGKNERLLLIRDISHLQQLEKVRTDFVANVSHELRTPLTVLKGYVETFLQIDHTLHPTLKRGLAQMQEQTQRMEALITDLLLLSKLESSPPVRTATSIGLTSLLTRVMAEAKAIYPHKEHSFELSVDARIQLLGHEEELHSAFSNMLINAVKYTQTHGHIQLQALVHEQEVWVEVIDNGPGIDPSYTPRLTERFFRGDPNRTQQISGTGLGLAIVKHILIRHEATLEIISRPGQGSCFRCRFPQQSFELLQTASTKYPTALAPQE